MGQRPPRPRRADDQASRPGDDDLRAPATLDVAAITAAIARRAGFACPASTTVRRLFDGLGDGMPGVVIDRYGPSLRLELWAGAWPAGVDAAVAVLAGLPGVTGVVCVLRTGAGRSELRVASGQVPEAEVVLEAGLRYLVRVGDSDAVGTGIFVDQREGRRLVREGARGRPALNLFAHAGAFGVAAAAGGASRVDHCDMARKCATWAATNLALNGHDPRAHRFFVDDALQILKKMARKQAGYGVIACDPPTQGTRRDGSHFVLRRSLVELATDGCRALDDGGLLILSCNDRDVPVSEVLEAAHAGGHAAQRKVASVGELALPDDITAANAPRGRPMRGAVVRLA